MGPAQQLFALLEALTAPSGTRATTQTCRRSPLGVGPDGLSFDSRRLLQAGHGVAQDSLFRHRANGIRQGSSVFCCTACNATQVQATVREAYRRLRCASEPRGRSPAVSAEHQCLRSSADRLAKRPERHVGPPSCVCPGGAVRVLGRPRRSPARWNMLSPVPAQVRLQGYWCFEELLAAG